MACKHKETRPSGDGDLAICQGCRRIVGALTPAGKAELARLRVMWSPAEPARLERRTDGKR